MNIQRQLKKVKAIPFVFTVINATKLGQAAFQGNLKMSDSFECQVFSNGRRKKSMQKLAAHALLHGNENAS